MKKLRPVKPGITRNNADKPWSIREEKRSFLSSTRLRRGAENSEPKLYRRR